MDDRDSAATGRTHAEGNGQDEPRHAGFHTAVTLELDDDAGRLGPPLATAIVEAHGPAVVVRVSGEIDHVTADGLRRVLTEQLRLRPAAVVVDLARVTFVASSGLAALIAARDVAASCEVPLRLANLPSVARRLLTITSLTGWFEIYDSTAAALA